MFVIISIAVRNDTVKHFFKELIESIVSCSNGLLTYSNLKQVNKLESVDLKQTMNENKIWLIQFKNDTSIGGCYTVMISEPGTVKFYYEAFNLLEFQTEENVLAAVVNFIMNSISLT